MDIESNSQRFWNNIAKFSKNKNLDTENLLSEKINGNLKKYFKSDKLVLDFACGTGDLTLQMAKRCDRIYAVDTAEEMLNIVRKKSREHMINNIECFNTKNLLETFSEVKFDVITAFNVLHYFKEVNLVFSQIHKLLKPNGIFISSTACLGEKRTYLSFILRLLIQLKLVPEMRYYKKDELKNELMKAGFIILSDEIYSNLSECLIIAKKE